jgi:hypothetical protein
MDNDGDTEPESDADETDTTPAQNASPVSSAPNSHSDWPAVGKDN